MILKAFRTLYPEHLEFDRSELDPRENRKTRCISFYDDPLLFFDCSHFSGDYCSRLTLRDLGRCDVKERLNLLLYMFFWSVLAQKFGCNGGYTPIAITYIMYDILYKNSYNTGFAKCQVLYELKNSKTKYHKINLDNGLICLIYSEINNGFIIKAIESNKNDIILKQKYYKTILQSFEKNNLFKINDIDKFDYYNLNKLIQVSSIMGDSGTGYYKINNTNVDLLGIGIGGCNILILSKNKVNNGNILKWDIIKNRLVFDEYIIEEIHKGSVINSIENIF
jgi:hypothetical protein